MRNLVVVAALGIGALAGWTARGSQRTGALDDTAEIVVQHPQQNPYGTGSTKTRIKLTSAGDDDFGPLPENTSNANFWVLTINGTNYRGVAQDGSRRETGVVCSSTAGP
jgi:hypothetical protein